MRVAGEADTPIRRVVWGARSPLRPAGRVYCCGLNGQVTEWDVRSLSPSEPWGSGGGAAWDMASHAATATLAVGCEDGGCSIFDTSDADYDSHPTLTHRTPPQGARLLCVAFSPQGSHLACSAADGSVRVWHVASWQALSRVVLESAGRRKPPLVWACLLLSDLTVVTGDSTGHVCFLDANHGTLVRRFASHQADVLALTASRDEQRVFASGVDQKVSLFTPQPAPPAQTASKLSSLLAAAPTPRGWAISFSRRPHTHDVRALTAYEPPGAPGDAAGEAGEAKHNKDGKGPRSGAMLLSGGIDTQLCLLPLADFERAPPLKLLPFPMRGAVALARTPRLLLAHNGAEATVWQLPDLPPNNALPAPPRLSSEGGDAPPAPRKLLLLRPKLAGRNIACAAIADDGRWLAVSGAQCALYRLVLGEGDDPVPAFRRVPLPDSALPACAAAFSRDGRLLVLGSFDGLVQVVHLPADAGGAAPTTRTLRPPPSIDAAAAAGDTGLAAIVQIAVSDDGQWVATADAARRVCTHSLDTLSFSSAVPPLPSPPTALAFVPGRSLLAVATARKHLVVYDVDRACLTPWSVAHAAPMGPVGASAEVAHSIAFNPGRPADAILVAQSWLCRVRIGDEAGEAPPLSPPGKRRGKRSRGAKDPGGGGAAKSGGGGGDGGEAGEEQVVHAYGAMLLFDFTAADTAVVVEQPWLKVMGHFPPALHRHRFGT